MSWWESAYKSGFVNWDPGDYDGHLPWLIERYHIIPGKVIDIGCGTGKSAVWLAEQGFSVVGIDLAPSAVRSAKRLAGERGVDCSFLLGTFPDDFSKRDLPDEHFDLVIERGFLQHLTMISRMRKTLKRISGLLREKGLFYSLIAAREASRSFGGPPRWTRKEIEKAFRGFFIIEEMKKSVFTPGEKGSIAAWVTIARPR